MSGMERHGVQERTVDKCNPEIMNFRLVKETMVIVEGKTVTSLK